MNTSDELAVDGGRWVDAAAAAQQPKSLDRVDRVAGPLEREVGVELVDDDRRGVHERSPGRRPTGRRSPEDRSRRPGRRAPARRPVRSGASAAPTAAYTCGRGRPRRTPGWGITERAASTCPVPVRSSRARPSSWPWWIGFVGDPSEEGGVVDERVERGDHGRGRVGWQTADHRLVARNVGHHDERRGGAGSPGRTRRGGWPAQASASPRARRTAAGRDRARTRLRSLRIAVNDQCCVQLVELRDRDPTGLTVDRHGSHRRRPRPLSSSGSVPYRPCAADDDELDVRLGRVDQVSPRVGGVPLRFTTTTSASAPSTSRPDFVSHGPDKRLRRGWRSPSRRADGRRSDRRACRGCGGRPP